MSVRGVALLPSLLLPAPPGSLLPCFCQSPCHHWDGGLYPCILDPLRHGLCCAGRGTVVGKPGSHRHLYHVEFCKVHRFQHCEWARGQGHGCPGGLRGRVPSPTAAIAHLPVAVGASAVRRPESCALLPLLLLGSLTSPVFLFFLIV